MHRSLAAARRPPDHLRGSAGTGPVLLVRQRWVAVPQCLPARGHAQYVAQGAELVARPAGAADDPDRVCAVGAPLAAAHAAALHPSGGHAHRHRAGHAAASHLRMLRTAAAACAGRVAGAALGLSVCVFVARGRCPVEMGHGTAALSGRQADRRRAGRARNPGARPEGTVPVRHPGAGQRFHAGPVATGAGAVPPERSRWRPARPALRRGIRAPGPTRDRPAHGQRRAAGGGRRRGRGRRVVWHAGGAAATRFRWRPSAATTSPCAVRTCACATR